MASLLSAHLDQLSLCATSIADLPFPAPKPFTTALLSPHHDITALIRDTEPYERALFHLAAPSLPHSNKSTTHGPPDAGSQRRQTGWQGSGAGRQARSRAVQAVLGGELYARTRGEGRVKGEVDVGLLLEGAERLGGVYPLPQHAEKLANLRARHARLTASIAHYEDRVARNTQELLLVNRSSYHHDGADDGGDEQEEVEGDENGGAAPTLMATKEDLRREEAEIRGLERKKRGLEERVEGMGRDLGGMMR